MLKMSYFFLGIIKDHIVSYNLTNLWISETVIDPCDPLVIHVNLLLSCVKTDPGKPSLAAFPSTAHW
jgi:hypothetical protein